MKQLSYFWRKGLWALLSGCFLVMICGGLLYLYLTSQLPHVESLRNVNLQVPLRIYTQDGLLIQEYGEKRRIPLQYKDIPETLIRAVLVTEDQRFFEHPGVDVLGLGRAMLRMVKTGTKSQGGSTITMQVARNFFLDRKKTFLRKFNEILLAVKIDRELSKEKILELYLNKIYLGNRAYGVGAAADVYYGKSLKELSLAELAMIAGLPQAPSTQNPIANPIAAKKRRNHVLKRLKEEGFISEQEYETARSEPVKVKYHGTSIKVRAPYVAEMIRQSMYDHFGENAYTRGYKVYTTIKSSLQTTANTVITDRLLAYDRRHGYRGPAGHFNELATKSPAILQQMLTRYPVFSALEPAVVLSVNQQDISVLRIQGTPLTIAWDGLSWARPALKPKGLGKKPSNAKQILSMGDVVYTYFDGHQWRLSQIPEVEAALVALDPHDGAVRALIGGFDFQKSKFNRAIQSERQPGSSFKPFVYAAALNQHYTLSTLVNDAPVVVEDPSQEDLWRPHNVNLTFNGPTRLREALVHSRNLVSIRVLDDIGFDSALDFISRFGFLKEKLPRALSLALGSLSITPLELTTAYAVFANGGFKVEPYLIDRITDNQDEILLQAKPAIASDDIHSPDVDASVLAPRVIPETISFLITSTLKDVIKRGTARAANVLNRQDLAGKTGTTNDQVDAWFAGYNPNLVVTTWVGFDIPQSLHEYAANLALPIWIDFMKVALANQPDVEVHPPERIVAVRIDPTTGLFVKNNQANAITEYFFEEDLPTDEEGNSAQLENPAPDTVPEKEELDELEKNSSSTREEQENLF
ncbi:MAG: penicillin-binding protein 1A [Legionella sp.]|nr:penicillin-binding protein 1A [Legionella sp.]